MHAKASRTLVLLAALAAEASAFSTALPTFGLACQIGAMSTVRRSMRLQSKGSGVAMMAGAQNGRVDDSNLSFGKKVVKRQARGRGGGDGGERGAECRCRSAPAMHGAMCTVISCGHMSWLVFPCFSLRRIRSASRFVPTCRFEEAVNEGMEVFVRFCPRPIMAVIG